MASSILSAYRPALTMFVYRRTCRACNFLALFVALVRAAAASTAPLQLAVSPRTAAVQQPVDLRLDMQSGDLPRGPDAEYRLTAAAQALNVSCSVLSASSVRCACTFSTVGAHVVSLAEGGDELGIAVVSVFEQPPAEHISRATFSLNGFDAFAIKLLVQEVPVKESPCARFLAAGNAFIVPLAVEKDRAAFVSLVGRSPEFPGSLAIAGIDIFYSLNCVHFTQVFAERHANMSVQPEKPYRVAFIYHDQVELENGWVYHQNVARLGLNVAFGKSVETLYLESRSDTGPNICGDHCDGPDGWCTKMNGCAGNGLSHSCYVEGKRLIEEEDVDMVVGVTFWYWPDLVQLATEYPGKRFLSTAPGSPAHLSSNFARAWIRRYQLTYMSGFVLGQHPAVRANPRVGYVCSFPGACKIAIGAFAKGLYESSGLQFSVFVTYALSWGNARRERIAAERFFKYYNVSAVSTICNTMEVYKVAAEQGGFSVGYATNVLPIVGPSVLSDFILSWEASLPLYVGSAMANESWSSDVAGGAPPLYTWAGLDAGGWEMTSLSPELPSAARRPILARLDDFVAGRDDIWCGTLRRPNGTKVETPILGSSPEVGPGECMGENPSVGFNAGWEYMAIRDSCAGDQEKHFGFCYLGNMNVTHDVPDVCPPGSELVTEGCAQCAAGFVSKSGVACVHCPDGTVASEDALTCLPCPDGATTIQDFHTEGLGLPISPSVHLREVVGAEACELACKVDERCDGFFLHVSSSCWTVDSVDRAALSENGTYKFYERRPVMQCRFCPGDAEYVFLPGQKPLCVCPKETYQAPGTDEVQCMPCKEGMECPGEGVIHLKPGFFAYSNDPDSVFQCFGETRRCPGGVPGSCAPGRLNTTVACGRCAPGQRASLSGPCVLCTGQDMLPLIALLCFAVALLAFLTHKNASHRRIHDSKSVIIIGLMFGQTGMLMQQMGVIAMISIEWREPLATLFGFFSLFTFNLEFLHLDCFANPSPTSVLLLKALMVVGFVLMQLSVHAARALLMRRRITDKLGSTICTLGSIFMIFLISLVSSLLAPFQCHRHPNGVLTVVAYPSVACWTQEYESPHLKMLAISSVASIIPISFVALCIYALCRLPSVIAGGNPESLDMYAFLVFRFRPGVFNFAFCAILRQALVSVTPVLMESTAQVASLMAIQLLYMAVVLRTLPWRIHLANVVDICTSLGVIAVLFLAGLFLTDVDVESVSTAMIVLIAASFLSILSAFMLGFYTSLFRSRTKRYRFFLCHHKAGAGSFARALKLKLTTSQKDRVFLDSDDLSDLTGLFARVAEDTANLVVLVSSEFWTRPWCMGELVTAKVRGVQVRLVFLPEGEMPRHGFIEGYEASVPGVTELFEHGISVAMVQDALRWVRTSTCDEVVAPVCSGTLDLVVASLSSQGSPGKLQSDPQQEPVAPRARTVLLVECRELEPVSLALVLKHLLTGDFAASGGAANVPFVLWQGEELPASVRHLLVICTHGVFHCRHVLVALAQATLQGADALPIVCHEHFSFPTYAFYEELKPIVDLTLTPLPPNKLLLAIRAIFTEIAIALSCSDSETILRARAAAIVSRLSSGRRPLRDRILADKLDAEEGIIFTRAVSTN